MLDTPGIDIRRIQLESSSFNIPGDKDRIHSLYILGGSGMINGKTIEKDDFVILDDGEDRTIDPHEGGMDIFVLSVPISTPYQTYAHTI